MSNLQFLIESFHNLRSSALEEIKSVGELGALEEFRVRWLGKKSPLSQILRGMGELTPEQRPEAGKVANEVKAAIQEAFDRRKSEIGGAANRERIASETVDITLPGRGVRFGGRHPLTMVMEEVCEIFRSLRFSVATGPDVETEFNNFEALNIPKDHPARDMQDTFYVEGGRLLRTHTSPVQIRTMLKHGPPVAIIAPGKVYRCDADVTHSPMFHQVEGLLVDEGVSFAHLKGTLEYFIHRFFGPEVGGRFRPSYFPFTEPSAEVDVQCVMCGGSGCRVCSQSGWLEILGAGMVHPAVLENVRYDSEKYTGFAFGMGVERLAMLKYSIGDIRTFFENDIRFLRQF